MVTRESDSPIAIITGASQGIGFACASRLAERGFRTVMMARSESIFAAADQIGGVAVQGDVSNPDDLAALVDETTQRFGRVDALINNTGHSAVGPMLEIRDDEWHAALDLYILNIVRVTRLVVPMMIENGSGSIVNISTYAARKPTFHFPLSSVLRSGLGNLAVLFSREYGQYGIRMNNVLPGFVATHGTALHDTKDDERTASALGRIAAPAEIGSVAAFLASADSTFITGEDILVDGGLL